MKSLTRTALIFGLAAAVLACTQVARAANAKKDQKEVQGKITAVDATAGTVTIKHKKDTMTFTAAPDIEFGGAGNKKITLADLKVGDHITVHYTEESGKLMAHKIGHVDVKANDRKD
ncbi:MAG TPA: copper-binding protein [Verrucomicrobiae bacterium]|nr:copper-binding protein [Verrucomicrobiae bacterium]